MLENTLLISFDIIDRRQSAMPKFVIMLIALVFYVHFSSEEDETSQMTSTIAFAVFVAMLYTLTFSI